MSPQHRVLIYSLFLLVFLTNKISYSKGREGYESYRIGSPDNFNAEASPGFLLAGGGTDVDEAMLWLLKKANGGDFLVIRAKGGSDYNQWLMDLKKTNSVETLVIASKSGAEEAYVLQRVAEAEAIFIAGGDQSDYVRYWKNTSLNAALNHAIEKGVPIGGTSAGLAVLGQYIYDAKHGSAVSKNALKNPYDPSISFTKDFLNIPLLREIITDSHFVSRDRMGRLIAYSSRLIEDGFGSRAFAIGVDEETALAVDSTGKSKVMGKGNVYFLKADKKAEICKKETPLQTHPLSIYRLGKKGSFNVEDWEGSGGEQYEISAHKGKLSSSLESGSIY